MIPSSRGGATDQYNLFPWRQKPHRIWHDRLFFNLTIVEIWNMLDYVHRKIFESDAEFVVRDWLVVCQLNKHDLAKVAKFDKDKRSMMEKRIPIEKIQHDWEKCFGGYSIEQARMVLKYMMLFMIFGDKMSDPEKHIFDNGHLEKLLRKVPDSGIRRWALDRCLGNCESLGNAKAKARIVIDKIRYSL